MYATDDSFFFCQGSSGAGKVRRGISESAFNSTRSLEASTHVDVVLYSLFIIEKDHPYGKNHIKTLFLLPVYE